MSQLAVLFIDIKVDFLLTGKEFEWLIVQIWIPSI